MIDKYLIVGLGNPGVEYKKTRHNIGARVVSAWQTSEPELSAQIKIYLPTEEVYMNDTGPTVAAIIRREGIDLDHLIVVHDELELPFGVIKEKLVGSAQGHNGVRSLQQALGSQSFRRLKIGIGRPTGPMPVDAYVLQRFTPEEEVQLPEIIQQAITALKALVN